MRPARTRATAGVALAVIALPLLGASCSKSDDTVATASTTTTAASSSPSTTAAEGGPVNAGTSVGIKEFAYEPDQITVKANETVTWTNNGSGKHTVTADPGQAVTFKSETMQPGNTFVFTFSAPGTYTYFCSVHGKDKMSGTITVT